MNSADDLPVADELALPQRPATLSITLPDSIANLVNGEAFADYTFCECNSDREEELGNLTVGKIFPEGTSDDRLGACCLSGIWLLHNFLDPSHAISQSLPISEGSYWHAIMHRLEGDYGNSKYWYRQVGEHPVFNSIGINPPWDPFEYVDRCQGADYRQRQLPPGARQEQRLLGLQHVAIAEWIALFEYCFKNAIG